MIHIDNLEPAGIDAWDRPLFRHTASGQYFCCVDDLDATLDTIRAGLDLYFKGDREGEPDYPVDLCRLPSIRCTVAPGSRLFTKGMTYPAFPCDSGSDNIFQVKDDLGHWRVMAWDTLRFIVENDYAPVYATFEVVKAPLSLEDKRALYRAGRYAFASPGVSHGEWSEADWIIYVDSQNGWLTEG